MTYVVLVILKPTRFWKEKKAKPESKAKSKSDTTDKMEVELKTIRSKSTTKTDKVEYAMMCWESTSNFAEEEPHGEPQKVAKKHIEKTEKQKHEEEHVKPTLNTGN